jgi:hypothetical protein
MQFIVEDLDENVSLSFVSGKITYGMEVPQFVITKANHDISEFVNGIQSHTNARFGWYDEEAPGCDYAFDYYAEPNTLVFTASPSESCVFGTLSWEIEVTPDVVAELQKLQSYIQSS